MISLPLVLIPGWHSGCWVLLGAGGSRGSLWEPVQKQQELFRICVGFKPAEGRRLPWSVLGGAGVGAPGLQDSAGVFPGARA